MTAALNLHPIVLSVVLAVAIVVPSPINVSPAQADSTAPGVRGELLRSLDDARNELIGLSLAIPEASYGWRPDSRQLTVAQVLLHVAQGNYDLLHLAGATVPDSLEDLVGKVSGKSNVIATLAESFGHVFRVIEAMPDNAMERPTTIFGRESTVRDALLLVVTHAHDHVGQMRTYAQSNGTGFPMAGRAEAFAIPKPRPPSGVVEQGGKPRYKR